MRVKVSEELDNNVIYVYHTIEENQLRILENDWIDIYGICNGLVTYKSTSNQSITIPAIASKYLYNAVDGEFVETEEYENAKNKIRGAFVDENGKEITFHLNAEPDYYIDDLEMYGTNIYVSYSPDIGWDESNPPPFYKLVIFNDNSIVVFDEKTEKYTLCKPLKNIRTAYIELLEDKNVYKDKTFASYCVYDIDNDGKKELIIKSGASEADAKLLFYK